MKYRKKPVVIEAHQFPQISYANLTKFEDFDNWLTENVGSNDVRYIGSTLHITTLEGVMVANAGDYIIRGVENEMYPCREDIFEKTYEPA